MGSGRYCFARGPLNSPAHSGTSVFKHTAETSSSKLSAYQLCRRMYSWLFFHAWTRTASSPR